jgi:hypothetical protein
LQSSFNRPAIVKRLAWLRYADPESQRTPGVVKASPNLSPFFVVQQEGLSAGGSGGTLAQGSGKNPGMASLYGAD